MTRGQRVTFRRQLITSPCEGSHLRPTKNVMGMDVRVADDETPRAAPDLAGKGVRAFNHRSGQRFSAHHNGWNHVPDVYRCLGELTYMTGMLAQVFGHMTSSMRVQLDAGHVAIDPGTPYEGNPELAVETACAALAAAERAARLVYGALAEAQNASKAASKPVRTSMARTTDVTSAATVDDMRTLRRCRDGLGTLGSGCGELAAPCPTRSRRC